MFQKVSKGKRILFFLIYLFMYVFMYLFIFGCVGSSLLHAGFLQLQRAGATLRCSAWASDCSGFSCCGTQALGHLGFSSCGTRAQQLWLKGSTAQAQQLWRTGLVSLWHVGSSWTRDLTGVPCIGRWILKHCTTREVKDTLNTVV